MADLTDERERITVLQRMLCMLAAAWGDPELETAVCGAWNGETERAVRAFQQKRCLPVTGICGRETWDAMAACCAEEEEKRAPVYVAVRELTLRPGDEGDGVLLLQLVLRGLAGEYPLPDVVPDGRYGDSTERAVAAFQKTAGLPQTGRADRQTWRAMAEAYNGEAGDC